MVQRALGTSGMTGSAVAFGAFKIGRNEKIKYAQGYALPTEEEAARILNGVLDMGISIIDTAPAYGVSEERIGRHLSHRRKELVLSTKVGEVFENGVSRYAFSKEAVRGSVEGSLRKLRTEAVDFLFIHSGGNDVEVLRETDVVEAMIALRQRGLARCIGLSGKTVEAARLALEWADALMVEYHTEDRSHEGVIEEAGRGGKAVFVKKPLASGAIPPAVSLPFILKRKEVSTLVIGGLSLDHMRENVRLAEEALGG